MRYGSDTTMPSPRTVLKAQTNILADSALTLDEDIENMTVQEVAYTLDRMEVTMRRLRASFDLGEFKGLMKDG